MLLFEEQAHVTEIDRDTRDIGNYYKKPAVDTVPINSE